MKTIEYKLIMRAEQPIAHAQESLGNVSVLARRKVRRPGGGFSLVPYVSGDAARHQLREIAARMTLDAIGLHSGMSQGALRLLFNGGMVTGKGDATTVNLDRYRELVALFPPLALLGGCTDNRPMPGTLEVGELNLICRETEHVMPAWARDSGVGPLDSARDHVEQVTRTRMDPTLVPERVSLLSSDDAAAIHARTAKSAKAHEDGDAVVASESKSAMMPREHECIARGSLFWWDVAARVYSDAEETAFRAMMTRAMAGIHVGGKRATGHGLIVAIGCMTPQAEASPEDYARHINREALRAWLTSGVNS